MVNEDLKALIKQIIAEELLDEMSSTGGSMGGGAGEIQTPNAFKKTEGDDPDECETDRMKKIAKHSMPDHESNVVAKHKPAKLDEARARYYNFKESDVHRKNSTKVSYVISEMKKMLKEIDYLATISNRLKTEAGVASTAYWKRSSAQLEEIAKYTKSISNKIKALR